MTAWDLDDALAWVAEYLPVVLPHPWRVRSLAADGAAFLKPTSTGALSVIVSGAVEQDGRRWLHVSLARPHRLPSYDDMIEVKRLFIGRDRYAVQVFPPADRHVNQHPNCLHLFHCADGHPLPEFTRGGASL